MANRNRCIHVAEGLVAASSETSVYYYAPGGELLMVLTPAENIAPVLPKYMCHPISRGGVPTRMSGGRVRD